MQQPRPLAAGERLEQRERLLKYPPLCGLESGDLLRQGGHSTGPPRLEEGAAGCRRFNPHQPAVLGVGNALDPAALFEAGDEPRHRRRAHLFRQRELADGERAAEHDDGEGGESRRTHAARVILATQAAEKMDRRRVQAIGERAGSGRAGGPPDGRGCLTGGHGMIS
jgi:hypothetical protein